MYGITSPAPWHIAGIFQPIPGSTSRDVGISSSARHASACILILSVVSHLCEDNTFVVSAFLCLEVVHLVKKAKLSF